jgi:hypothetical protein
MKNILFFALLFCFVSACNQPKQQSSSQASEAQNGEAATKNKPTISNLERFSQRSGTLIQRKFILLGKYEWEERYQKIAVNALIVTDLMDSSTSKGIHFQNPFAKFLGFGLDSSISKGIHFQYMNPPDGGAAFIDMDELDGLMKSLHLLETTVFSTKKSDYTEIIFQSRGGFEAGCYYSIEAGKWVTYLQLQRYNKNSIIYLTPSDFTTLYKWLEKAKTVLM